MRLTIGEGGQLLRRDGTVLGVIDTISLHGLICPNCGVSYGGKGEEVVEVTTEEKTTPPPPDEPEQTALMPSPITVVWQHYQETVDGASRRGFDSTRRTCVRRALKVRSVDECCQAIDALARSAWHNGENPDHRKYLDIQYALGQKSESADERIDKMIGRLGGNVSSPDSGDISQLLAAFRNDNGPVSYQTFVAYIDNINRWLHNRDSRTLKASAENQMAEIERWGYELVIGKPDGRDREFVTGYRKVA